MCEPATAEIVWFTYDVPAVCDDIEITYDPDDPSYATEAGSDSDAVMGIVYVVRCGRALSPPWLARLSGAGARAQKAG